MTRMPACSNLWDDPDRPAWGTAQQAAFVVALEQPGPWGAKALVESRLDPDIGVRLERACQQAGGLALLVRRPGRSAEEAAPQVLVSGGPVGATWLLVAEARDPAAVVDLPFADLATLAPDAAAAALPGFAPADAAVLVCANGRRDVCCAVRGRPVAAATDAARPGRVWEATHLGGHRFAPTAIVLPTRHALGRVSPSLLVDALDAAASGRLGAAGLHPFHLRGLMALAQPDQVADAAVRAATGESRPEALTVAGADAVASVTHADGRSWEVALTPESVEERLSCGKPAEVSRVWRAAVDPR